MDTRWIPWLLAAPLLAGSLAASMSTAGAADDGLPGPPPLGEWEPGGIAPYAIRDLGTLGGATSRAYGINDHGLVVGVADAPDGTAHPFLFFPAPCGGLFCLSGMLDIDAVSDDDLTGMRAVAIDESNRVVGYDPSPERRAFRYELATGTVVASAGRQLRDIRRGVQVGWKITGEGDRAFLTDLEDGENSVSDLGNLGGNTHATATTGHVVVGDSVQFYQPDSGLPRPFLWTPGDELLGIAAAMFELSSFSPSHSLSGSARDVVVTGPRRYTVAGTSHDVSLPDHRAARWDVQVYLDAQNAWQITDTVEDLGTLAGHPYSAAEAVAAGGEVVGWSWSGITDQPARAVRWDAAGGIHDLNEVLPSLTPFFALTRASDLNAAGQIVGTGLVDTDGDGAGESHAFLLTPCSASLDPDSVSAGAGQTSITVEVSAPQGCAWSARIGAAARDWITMQHSAGDSGGGSTTAYGSGTGSIRFVVETNTSTSPRQGQIAVAGLTVSVDQAGAARTLRLPWWGFSR